MPGALVEHRTCPPALCPERARASFPALAEPQRPASLCFAPFLVRDLSFAYWEPPEGRDGSDLPLHSQLPARSRAQVGTSNCCNEPLSCLSKFLGIME